VEKDFAESCWPASDTLTYTFEAEAGEVLQTAFQVQLQENYPYRNLFLKVMLLAPSGDRQDTLVQEIFVDELGYWMREPDWRGGYTVDLRDTLRFTCRETGKYALRYTHYMRDSVLCYVDGTAMFVLE
jgi:gliding motility-associated lipoprotein GldH